MNHKKKSHKKLDLLDEQQRIYKRIGERIKQLRLSQGHTSQELFAYEHDIDRSQLGRFERGSDMRMSSLVKILLALDVTIGEFFKGME